MWKDKPTGIKILWVWTIGTAAVLLTCVSKTRMQDMEKFINNQPPPQQQQGISTVDSVIKDGSSSLSDENIITEDKS